MRKHLVVAVCCLLSACMVGPDYKEPAKTIPSHWKTGSKSVTERNVTHPAWWRVFHDPTLTALINMGYTSNLPLQTMGVKVLAARAVLAKSVGELYPQQQAIIGNYTYNRIGGGSLQQLLPTTFDTASLGFTINWELDFWGKYRRAIQSNNAAFLASIAAYDQALVTLTADIANTYIKIRTLESQINVTKANISVQTVALQLADARYQTGEASLVDVEQAKTELAETEARLPTLMSDLQREKDALCVLLGKAPNQLDAILKKGHGIPRAPFSVAVGIPREDLAKRPDIEEARLEAMTQSELIGATKANLFPALSLAGTFALTANNINSSSMSDLFTWSNRAATAGPAVNWPFLNYGQITNAVRIQDAAFQEALLNYMNLALKAAGEVQDNITSFVQAKVAASYLSSANRAATTTLKLAMIRYREGETDFTPVLNAEQQQLRVQSSLINAEGDVPQSLVALYRSLGGGWEIRKGHDVVPDDIKREMANRTNWGTLFLPENHEAPKNKSEVFNDLYVPKW